MALDDTDGVDDDAEKELWKVRELMRIKRDREERSSRLVDAADIERRRQSMFFFPLTLRFLLSFI